ncbi:hypothetical protein CCAN12_710022 [Capnocytophaga canimorsus]|uniref:Uncharacterized protein n=1 Tax=Capnocytophaga canimorsus TaxID=28188 RepID=A0A0B7HIL6_9FLAO|nr:hypothetical protein CCAN12_710022 [Capnocytophaga canimorsus]
MTKIAKSKKINVIFGLLLVECSEFNFIKKSSTNIKIFVLLYIVFLFSQKSGGI